MSVSNSSNFLTNLSLNFLTQIKLGCKKQKIIKRKKLLLKFGIMEMIVNLRFDFEMEEMRNAEVGSLDGPFTLCFAWQVGGMDEKDEKIRIGRITGRN